MLELAHAKSTEELLAVVLERCKPPLDAEAETSWKASWALLLQAEESPAEVCALLRATLLGLCEKGTVSARLLSILGWCQHAEAAGVLFDLLRSGWSMDRQSLLAALLKSGRGCDINLELQLREIEKLADKDRTFFVIRPPGPSDSRYTPFRPDVCRYLADFFASGAEGWNLQDRKSLGYALGNVVYNWMDHEQWRRQQGQQVERPEYIGLIPQLLMKRIGFAQQAEERLCLLHALSQCEAVEPDIWRTMIHHAQNEPDERTRLECLPYCYPFRDRPEVRETLLAIGRYDESLFLRSAALQSLPAEGEYLHWKMSLALQEFEKAQGRDYATDTQARINSIRVLETCGLPGVAPLERIAHDDPDGYVRDEAVKAVNRVKAKCAREAEEARKRAETDRFWEDIRQGRMPHVPENDPD
ncbi:MAG: hypothetical protein RDV41_09645 [Planctomycetota bacterium]|nr:hypothetical protein [Planctomycetota bacterium]